MRRILAVTLGVVLTAAVNTSALAHSGLKDTSPRRDERVTTPVTVIRLTFNESVSAPRVVVRNSQRRVAGSLGAKASIIEFRPTAPITAGNVTVTWQVRSRDGHTISGKWSFVVSASARATTKAP
jgi:methionine-rich copper-binding protein CopC